MKRKVEGMQDSLGGTETERKGWWAGSEDCDDSLFGHGSRIREGPSEGSFH